MSTPGTPFAALETEGYAEFHLQGYGHVLDIAKNMYDQLVAQQPDWCTGQKPVVEVIKGVGAVIVKNVLKVDIASMIFGELLANGMELNSIKGKNATGSGRVYGSGLTEFEKRGGKVSATEESLVTCYEAAVGVPNPHILYRDYAPPSGEDDVHGYQFSHTDSGVRFPTVLFGSGPGMTRIAKQRITTHYPTDVDMNFVMDPDSSYDLNVNPGDFGVFDGFRHLHQGMRNPQDVSDMHRRVVALNVSSL
jgi:hypothetical protein